MKNVIFVQVQKIVNALVAKTYLKDKNVMYVKKNTFGKKKLQRVLKHVLMANLVKLAHVNVKSAIKIVKHALDQKTNGGILCVLNESFQQVCLSC